MLLQILPRIKEDYYAPAMKLILQAFLIRNLHLYGWTGVERGVEREAEKGVERGVELGVENSVAGQANGGR